MFIGIVAFAVAAVLAVLAYSVLIRGRRDYEAEGSAEDVLTDEEFRRIEFGDDA